MHFRVETAGAFTAPSLVLATGGLSIPKMGATDFAYDVARRFGLRITETLPGLVPLTASPRALGVADVLVRASRSTHRVAAARKLPRKYPVHPSRPLRPGDPADLVLLAAGRSDRARPAAGDRRRGIAEERKRARPKAEPKTVLGELFPARLAQALADALPQATMANIPDRTINAFAARLKRWELTPAGSEGYAKAEVTVGGIDTRDLSSKTMEARKCPACTSSVKRWTSPAGSAATISNGPGPAAGVPDRPVAQS